MTARTPTYLALAALTAIPALAETVPTHPAPRAEPEAWEAWYSVSARVRGARADADLEASGRLSMAGVRAPSGELHLSLLEVREHPWKLYWVNPMGPQPDGGVRLHLVTALAAPGPHIERETMLSSGGRLIGDRIRVEVSSKRLGNLEVEVGYRRADLQEESR